MAKPKTVWFVRFQIEDGIFSIRPEDPEKLTLHKSGYWCRADDAPSVIISDLGLKVGTNWASFTSEDKREVEAYINMGRTMANLMMNAFKVEADKLAIHFPYEKAIDSAIGTHDAL